MCKTDSSNRKRPSLRLLYSLDSFSLDDEHNHKGRPPVPALLLTGALFLAVLVLSEHACRHLLTGIIHWHELLENETNRQILARHVGVDALACLVVFAMGWTSRHLHFGLFESIFSKANDLKRNSMPKAAYPARLFTYQPSGFRVALLFFVYQIKNLYDSFAWNDGPEYIFHHIFSLITAWGCMFPGMGHYYSIFFFGMCELSTAIVCILANFDAEQGVPGLGEALPMTKITVGVIFIVLFITCRCILWPVYSYFFARDVLTALKEESNMTAGRKRWMKFFLVSLTGLSVLQVAWLGQIFVVAKEEFTKMGLM